MAAQRHYPRIIDINCELLTTAPRKSSGYVSRFKTHGSKHAR
jgi:hypothetical protein